MSLRTRLIIAFLLLSVVPLSAVTFIAYQSWVSTFEAAAQREAAQSAVDIGRRMERITADIGRRMDRMFVAAPQTGGDGRGGMRERVAPMLGDAAALVERVEFHPSPGAGAGAPPPPPPIPGRPGERGAAGGREGRADGPARDGSPSAFRGRGPRGGGREGWSPPGAPPAPPPVPEVIVVDVQEAVEAARRVAQTEMAGAAPELAPLVEESLGAVASSTDAAVKSAAAAAARAATTAAGAATVQMQVEGRRVQIAVRQDGKVVGTANATLNLDRMLRTVFAFARRDQGEIPFAIDIRGVVHNPDPDQLDTLNSFGVAALGPAAADGRPRRAGDWLIVSRKDPSGLIFGIARPMGESLREIRRASVRTLSLGLGAIALALIGIVPIAHGMTRRLASLDAGVRQLAAGDFAARVPVRTRDEFGSLAAAFNQMAEDLERHQAAAVHQERLRRELELSRLIQTQMLPKTPLRLGPAEIKGISIPAREVGGDFFNYFPLGDGRLAFLVGDVSGKGVSAALLMANVQATMRARLTRDVRLSALAAELDREIDATTPGAVYLTLFFGVLDPVRRVLTYVNAGHNPQFLIRAGGGLDGMPATGLPIALYPGQPYTEGMMTVDAGDLIFFYTDGVVEAEDASGEPFGLDRLQAVLAGAGGHGIDAVLQRVEETVRDFRQGAEPHDDATMMALTLSHDATLG